MTFRSNTYALGPTSSRIQWSKTLCRTAPSRLYIHLLIISIPKFTIQSSSVCIAGGTIAGYSIDAWRLTGSAIIWPILPRQQIIRLQSSIPSSTYFKMFFMKLSTTRVWMEWWSRQMRSLTPWTQINSAFISTMVLPYLINDFGPVHFMNRLLTEFG